VAYDCSLPQRHGGQKSVSSAQALPAPFAYPYVEVVHYRIESGEPHRYAEHAHLDGAIDGFRYSLKYRSAAFFPLERYTDQDAARAALEPKLRAWELDTDLWYCPGALRFKFLSAQVHAAAPQPGAISGVAAICLASVTVKAYATVTASRFRPPPTEFAVNDCVQDVAALLIQAKADPMVFLKNTYSIVTRLDFEFGGRAAAAQALRISRPVLTRLARLATERGTGAEVRKFTAARSPLSPEEREWMTRALEAIVRRTGALASGAAINDDYHLAS
jgi:hypothetical protein